MPRIDLMPDVLYEAMQPYNSEYDNLPLKQLLARQQLINFAVDNNAEILRESIGTAGTLSNRLAQSIDDDGSLKSSAIDDAEHNIGQHADGAGSYTDPDTLVTSTVNFVRMLESERDKLSLISSEATALALTVTVSSPSETTVNFEDATVELLPSDTIQWSLTAPNKIKAVTSFPSSAAHQHFYDQEPDPQGGADYQVNTLATPFVDGTLRVYVNGIRLSSADQVYVPPHTGPDGTWLATSFTPVPASGTFSLNRTLNASDVIRIDYDRLYS